ncbi:hypothetical protein ACN28S_45150 [Cystobacter fuscus]
MPSRSKHTPFFISPVTTHADKDNGVLHFRATLLEGFTTRFSAHTLDTKDGGIQDITDEVKWEFDESFIGNTGRFEVEDKNCLRG